MVKAGNPRNPSEEGVSKVRLRSLELDRRGVELLVGRWIPGFFFCYDRLVARLGGRNWIRTIRAFHMTLIAINYISLDVRNYFKAENMDEKGREKSAEKKSKTGPSVSDIW